MDNIRTAISALLDKVEALLKGEPVRLIGYGAAAVVYATVLVMNAMGVTTFGAGLSFDAALALSLTALVIVNIAVERIRMFVYSPQTYIEDLSDAVVQGHEEAHAEEAFSRMVQQATNEAVESIKARRKKAVNIGTAKSADATKDLSN